MENEMQKSDEFPKIKIIGRIQSGAYKEELLSDDADSGALAHTFLQTFSPAALVRQLVQRYGEQSVLVFRTDAGQMEEFRALLEAHGTSLL